MRYLECSVLAAFLALGMSTGGMSFGLAEIRAIQITGSNGTPIGQLMATASPHGVLLKVSIAPGGLTPGAHGMHLHAVGDCSDVGTFKKSMGHINVGGKAHGLLNPAGPDDADLPNLHVAADGSATAEVFSSRVRLLSGELALLDENGSALVIHANADDHLRQPIGGAGSRVGCAELNRHEK